MTDVSAISSSVLHLLVLSNVLESVQHPIDAVRRFEACREPYEGMHPDHYKLRLNVFQRVNVGEVRLEATSFIADSVFDSLGVDRADSSTWHGAQSVIALAVQSLLRITEQGDVVHDMWDDVVLTRVDGGMWIIDPEVALSKQESCVHALLHTCDQEHKSIMRSTLSMPSSALEEEG